MTTAFDLRPARIPEWEAEDTRSGMLTTISHDPVEVDSIRQVLDGVRFELPEGIVTSDLVAFAQAQSTPLGEELAPDLQRYTFTLAKVPLNILLPDNLALVRMRLSLAFEQPAAMAEAEPALAYDVFPNDSWHVEDHDHGVIGLDVSKLLMVFAPAPAAGILDLKLQFPIKWQTQVPDIRATGFMSSVVDWMVSDAVIANGFIGYVIVRSPQGTPVTARASLAAELRGRGALNVPWGRFAAKDDHRYPIVR